MPSVCIGGCVSNWRGALGSAVKRLRNAMGQVRYAEELPRNAAELPHYAMGRRERPQNCRTMS